MAKPTRADLKKAQADLERVARKSDKETREYLEANRRANDIAQQLPWWKR